MAEATVYIVDDDAALGDSLRALFMAMGFDAHWFASGQALLEADLASGDACVLLDVRMPGIDGISLLDRLRELHPRLPVVIMTGYADVPLAVRAMQIGAADVVEKPFQEGAALAAVRNALARGGGGGDSATGGIDGLATSAGLTPRERQVLDMIVRGQANKVIAADLGISQRTVEVHRAGVMRKTGTRSVAELVRRALGPEGGVRDPQRNPRRQ